MKNFILFLFTLSSFAFSQTPADKWYFGTNAGLNFTGGGPTAIISSGMNAFEGTASISDANGNLLFYTDGITVWNKNNLVMNNGTGLMGNLSSTQAAIIVPTPSNISQYYIFTTDAQGGPNGLRYSVVDMSLSSGLGSIIIKNTLLLTPVCEKIAAIKDKLTGNRYWLMCHGVNNRNFYAYEINSSGIQPPVISSIGIVHRALPNTNMIGQMKFNSCGYQLAMAGGMLDTVQVFNFSLISGQVTNPITIPVSNFPYGIEFSAPVTNMLYVTTSNVSQTMIQYDLFAGSQSAIIASKSIISTNPNLTALQLGPDGNIYVSNDGSSFIGRINNSSSLGVLCNFVVNSINLDPTSSGKKCSWGLPAISMDNYFPCGIVGVKKPDQQKENLLIYPNPSSSEFNLANSNELYIEVYSHVGILIEKFASENKKKFGQNYLPGIYFVRLNGETIIKVIKN